MDLMLPLTIHHAKVFLKLLKHQASNILFLLATENVLFKLQQIIIYGYENVLTEIIKSDFYVHFIASSEDLDEKVKPVVQQRGRFKVTSENVDLEKVLACLLYIMSVRLIIFLKQVIVFMNFLQVVAAPPSPALQKSISMQVSISVKFYIVIGYQVNVNYSIFSAATG